MNKGFEVIEARWLFGFPASRVDVVIHPQSTVHSMVEFLDGSILAQLSVTDMKIPIQYALTYPDRLPAADNRLSLENLGKLDFSVPDPGRFRCLELAYQALEAGGTATCVLNAADEVAVGAFLAGRIGFLAIPRVIEEALNRIPPGQARNLDELLECDRAARAAALGCLTNCDTQH